MVRTIIYNGIEVLTVSFSILALNLISQQKQMATNIALHDFMHYIDV